MKFKDAPDGAKFRFLNNPEIKETFVKLSGGGSGLIVEWKGNIIGHRSYCCWEDKENGYDFDTEIEVID